MDVSWVGVGVLTVLVFMLCKQANENLNGQCMYADVHAHGPKTKAQRHSFQFERTTAVHDRLAGGTSITWTRVTRSSYFPLLATRRQHD